MSRSLVGSSSTSTLDGRVNSRASSSRFRSPPESDAHRRARPLGREEEVLEVAEDVPRLAVDRDRSRRRRRCCRCTVRLLVELLRGAGRSRRPRAWCRAGPSRLSGASSPSSSRSRVVLPEPLGPMMPTLSPRMMVVVKSRTIGAVAVGERDALRLDRPACPSARPPAPASRTVPVRSRRALALAAHRFEGADPALVAGAARLDALCGSRLPPAPASCRSWPTAAPRRRARPPCARGRCRSRTPSRPAGRGRARRCGWPARRRKARSWVTKSSVIRRIEQEVLQPRDRVDVEVVGRLVEQQHVGPAHQRPRQQHLPLPAAGERFERRVGVERRDGRAPSPPPLNLPAHRVASSAWCRRSSCSHERASLCSVAHRGGPPRGSAASSVPARRARRPRRRTWCRRALREFPAPAGRR